MNITLPLPYGIDRYIQDMQTALYARLSYLWGLNDDNYNCYGRVYRNKVEDGYIPEFYNPDQQQYVTGANKTVRGGMFFEDSLAAVSFLYLNDPVSKTENRDDYAKLQHLFFVDLTKITPGGISNSQGQRLDEVAINDVRNFFNNFGHGFTIEQVYRNVDKVLESFSGEAKRNTLNRDMQPRLCFRVDIELRGNFQLYGPDSDIPAIPIMIDRSIVLYIVDSPDPDILIPVGNGRYIQAQYAPGETLTPKRIGDGNGYLAGRTVYYPFTYNDQPNTVPQYNETTGVWTRPIDGDGNGGFQAGDIVAITFQDVA